MNDEYKSMHVLIVDDFEMIRATIRLALEKLEIPRIEEAENGEQALVKLHSLIAAGERIDLIFCDWNMPKMSGIQLLEACKKDPKLSSIPFIMVTSESDKAQVLEAIRLGAADYIAKPFAVETIEKKLQRIKKKA